MTTYNVHIYREMKLKFNGIEADAPEAAASIARDKPTEEADSIDDCDGETLAALVDVAGDDEFEQSVTIDFEKERERKAAPKLLMAVRMAENYLADDLDEDDETEMRIFKAICDARAEANAAGIRAEPTASALMAALKAVLPHAESERATLEQCWGRDGDARVKEELEACDRALEQALAVIVESHAPRDKVSGGSHEPR